MHKLQFNSKGHNRLCNSQGRRWKRWAHVLAFKRLFMTRVIQYSVDDLSAVKPAILDEDLSRFSARGHDSRQINPRHVRFHRLRVERRLHRLGIDYDAHRAQEIVVGMIAGEREDEVVLEFQVFARDQIADADRGGFDLRDDGLEIRFDLAVGDAVFDVGQYPVFDSARPSASLRRGCPARWRNRNSQWRR